MSPISPISRYFCGLLTHILKLFSSSSSSSSCFLSTTRQGERSHRSVRWVDFSYRIFSMPILFSFLSSLFLVSDFSLLFFLIFLFPRPFILPPMLSSPEESILWLLFISCQLFSLPRSLFFFLSYSLSPVVWCILLLLNALDASVIHGTRRRCSASGNGSDNKRCITSVSCEKTE